MNRLSSLYYHVLLLKSHIVIRSGYRSRFPTNSLRESGKYIVTPAGGMSRPLLIPIHIEQLHEHIYRERIWRERERCISDVEAASFWTLPPTPEVIHHSKRAASASASEREKVGGGLGDVASWAIRSPHFLYPTRARPSRGTGPSCSKKYTCHVIIII